MLLQLYFLHNRNRKDKISEYEKTYSCICHDAYGNSLFFRANGYWIRPWDMFFGLRTENGSAEPRFVKIAEDLEETVPEDAEIVHSETLARYSLAGREGDTVLVRNTGTPSSVRR